MVMKVGTLKGKTFCDNDVCEGETRPAGPNDLRRIKTKFLEHIIKAVVDKGYKGAEKEDQETANEGSDADVDGELIEFPSKNRDGSPLGKTRGKTKSSNVDDFQLVMRRRRNVQIKKQE